MSGLRKGQSNHSTVIRAFVLLGILIALIAYDVLRETVHLPVALRFISPEATALIYTVDLSKTWDDLAEHAAPVFKQPRAESVAEFVSDVKELLGSRCIAPVDGDDLRRFGIDAGRGAAIAAIGQLGGNQEDNEYVFVLPVTSSDDFANTLASFSLEAGSISISGAGADKDPVGYRIALAGHVEQGRLCTLDAGEVVEIGHDPVFVKNNQLYFSPGWFAESTFGVECSAVYADGDEGDCTCELDPGDFEADNEDCLQSINVTTDEEYLSDYRVGFMEVDGLDDIELKGVFVPDSEMKVIFVDDRWAIISDSDTALVAALSDPTRNQSFHENSDALRSLLLSPDLIDSGKLPGESTLAGMVRLPWLYGNSPITFDLRSNVDRLSLDLIADLPPGNMTLIDRLIGSSNEGLALEIVPYGSKVALALADKHLAYYLRYLFEYVDGAYDRVAEQIGHLAAAIRELSYSDSLSALSLTVPHLNDGVPAFALVAQLNDWETARTIMLNLQRQLRTERDIQVLRGAIERYAQINGSLPANISVLAETGIEADAEDTYLVSEPYATWNLYSIEGGNPVSTGLPDNLFDSDSYTVALVTGADAATSTAESITLRYLLPPVTDNDIQYRYDDLDVNESDEFDDDEAVSESEALKSGTNRLVAAYVDQTGMLWVGSDAGVLESILRSGADRRTSKQYALAREMSGGAGAVRATLFVQTGWALEQAIAHPDFDINEQAMRLVDLGAYQRLLVTVTALEKRNGLKARFELLK